MTAKRRGHSKPYRPDGRGPRIPIERYERLEQQVTKYEQILGIRNLKRKVPKSATYWMSEAQLIDIEERFHRICKKLEIEP